MLIHEITHQFDFIKYISNYIFRMVDTYSDIQHFQSGSSLEYTHNILSHYSRGNNVWHILKKESILKLRFLHKYYFYCMINYLW